MVVGSHSQRIALPLPGATCTLPRPVNYFSCPLSTSQPLARQKYLKSCFSTFSNIYLMYHQHFYQQQQCIATYQPLSLPPVNLSTQAATVLNICSPTPLKASCAYAKHFLNISSKYPEFFGGLLSIDCFENMHLNLLIPF